MPLDRAKLWVGTEGVSRTLPAELCCSTSGVVVWSYHSAWLKRETFEGEKDSNRHESGTGGILGQGSNTTMATSVCHESSMTPHMIVQ